MKSTLLALCAVASLCLMSIAAAAEPEVGKPAPDFGGTDSNGKAVHLSDFKGAEVVLEWSNDSCPYVKKWYGSGEMQKLQAEAAKLGVIWLTIISSAPGHEGFVSGDQANQDTSSRNAVPTHVLLDPSGTIGHLYAAKTTPHMFVIGKDGKLDYMGGADSIPSTDPADIAKAEPYAREAIIAVASGKPVAHAVTRAYGCNVKYGS